MTARLSSLLILIFLSACSSKISTVFNLSPPPKKKLIDYNMAQESPILAIDHSVLEESKYILQEQKQKKSSNKVLSIISFEKNTTRVLKYLSDNQLLGFKYYSGEGIGLVIAAYLQQGHSIQEIKWDFYKLNQSLNKSNSSLYTLKGMELFSKIILSKFKNSNIENNKSYLILPECKFNGVNTQDTLYNRLKIYFEFLVRTDLKISCEDHLKQIVKYMHSKLNLETLYFSRNAHLTNKVMEYIENIDFASLSHLQLIEIND